MEDVKGDITTKFCCPSSNRHIAHSLATATLTAYLSLTICVSSHKCTQSVRLIDGVRRRLFCTALAHHTDCCCMLPAAAAADFCVPLPTALQSYRGGQTVVLLCRRRRRRRLRYCCCTTISDSTGNFEVVLGSRSVGKQYVVNLERTLGGAPRLMIVVRLLLLVTSPPAIYRSTTYPSIHRPICCLSEVCNSSQRCRQYDEMRSE